jgi:hypothetical protein
MRLLDVVSIARRIEKVDRAFDRRFQAAGNGATHRGLRVSPIDNATHAK